MANENIYVELDVKIVDQEEMAILLETVQKGTKGDKGDPGDKGDIGETPVLSIGTVTDVPHGTPSSAEITGTPEAPVLNLHLQTGASGNETIDDAAGIGDNDLVWSADKVKKTKADIIDVMISTPSDVMSFPDGADGLPMTVTAEINPVQDLHGYDSPWPAGGGKNKLENASDSYLIANVSYHEYTVANLSLYSNVEMTFSIVTNDIKGKRIALYKNGDVIKVGNYGVKNITFTMPTVVDTDKLRLYLQEYTADSVSITGAQLELGSTATAWSPYSNICPISGWDSANVSRTGKNLLKLFDTDSTHRGIPITKENGVVKRVGTWDSTNLASGFSITGKTSSLGNYSNYSNTTENNTIKLKPGTYTASAQATKATNASNLQVFFATFSSLGGTIANGIGIIGDAYGSIIGQAKTWTFTLTEESYFYCGINSTVSSDGTAVDWAIEVQLEVGNSVSAFEPYNANEIEYEFPQEAGTVYGGTLTIHQDGTGTLVATHKMWTTDRNTPWTIVDEGTADVSFYSQAGYGFDAKTSDDNGYSNYFKYRYSFNTRGTIMAYSNRININKGSGFTSVAELQAAFAQNPLQVLYPLATPVTYQLTNQQVIETLKGVNNVWADCGAVSLEYPADTKLYIDGKIAEIQALILENISNS